MSILSAEGLKKRYGAEIVLKDVSLRLSRGDRVALIGPNGCGKTTLLKTIVGELAPLAGRVELGHDVCFSYFRQSQWEDLQGDQTVLEALMAGKHQKISEARDFLGRFLFSGDEVFKRLSELSGGERSRVALAQLAQLGGNFLLLDEPTNHLDIQSREVLQEALRRYEGTVLFVSHDRYLIRELATQIWEIRGGECHIYPGDYEYYLRRRAEEPQEQKPQHQPKRTQRRQAKSEEKALKQRLKKLKAREAELTEALSQLEEALAHIEEELQEASYAQDHVRIRELTQLYEKQRSSREELYRQWAAVAEELEGLSLPMEGRS